MGLTALTSKVISQNDLESNTVTFLRLLALPSLLLLPAALRAADSGDARALINRALVAEGQNRERMVNYLFLEQVTRNSYDRNKQLVHTQSSAFEVIFIEGRPAFRRVSVNGRKLTEEEEQAETARLRQLAEDRRRAPEIPSPAEDRRRAHPFHMFRMYHDFVMAGEETIDGRNCWVVTSKPRKGRHGDETPDMERILNASAKFWIDKETLHRVRMDVTATKPSGAAKVNEYTSYQWGQRDGSVWLITSIRTVLPLSGSGNKSPAYYEGEQTYSNYRRFGSESSVSAIEELAGPPTP